MSAITSQLHVCGQEGQTDRFSVHFSFSICYQGILWTRLDEEWQKWEDAIHHENNKAFQWCMFQSTSPLHFVLCYWMWNDNTEYLFPPFLCKISNLIATEILRCDDVVTRLLVIEKWVAVADICRCFHNYNAVLEITSSLNRSSVFRLKKTWLKASKQVCISLTFVC